MGFELCLELLWSQGDILNLLSLLRWLLSASTTTTIGCLACSPLGEICLGNADHSVDFNVEGVSSWECILDSAEGGTSR